MKENSRRKKIIGSYSLVFPNLFTTGNLFCGFYSLISSLKGNYTAASYLILIAALFDLVDGRVARLVKGASDFGREYDSLADLVSFGVAPVILAYLYALSDIPRLGWLVAFLFVACGALRLARFNVISNTRDPKIFIGLPIPVAAVAVATGILFFKKLGIVYERNYIFLILIFIVSFLMVSSVKYKSYRRPYANIKNEFFTNMVLFLLLLVIVAVNPELVLFMLCIIYILHGLLGSVLRGLRSVVRQRHRRHEEIDGEKSI